jgi:hypothetical protein
LTSDGKAGICGQRRHGEQESPLELLCRAAIVTDFEQKLDSVGGKCARTRDYMHRLIAE